MSVNNKRRLMLVAQLALILLAGAIGLWVGPQARAVYTWAFPPRAFETGDYARLYAESGKPVVLFSSSTCPWCKRARELLESEGVAYRDFVVDQDPAARERFRQLGGNGVPVLFLGDRRIQGFNESVIRASLLKVRPAAG